VSISRDYWIYFDITQKSSKNSEFWEKVARIGTFCSSKFLRLALQQTRRIKWVSTFVARNHPLTGAVTSCRHLQVHGRPHCNTLQHLAVLVGAAGAWEHVGGKLKVWTSLFPLKVDIHSFDIYNIGNSVYSFHHQASCMTKKEEWKAHTSTGLVTFANEQHILNFDWCCFWYFVRNSLVALPESLFAQTFFRFEISIYWHFLCGRPLSLTTALFPSLQTRLLRLVVAIPLVYWSHMCACVYVLLHVRSKTLKTPRAMMWKMFINNQNARKPPVTIGT